MKSLLHEVHRLKTEIISNNEKCIDESLLADDSYDIEVEMSISDDYKSKLSYCLAATNNTETIVSQTPHLIIPTSNRSHLKLPELPLPTYSQGKLESLAQFIHSFENIVAKYNFNEY